MCSDNTRMQITQGEFCCGYSSCDISCDSDRQRGVNDRVCPNLVGHGVMKLERVVPFQLFFLRIV